MPKVSVVIPTYNRKDTLGEAIDSVLHQIYTDYEIIVVDHGSTDGSFEWMTRTYGNKIQAIRSEFCPLPACPRNRGIEAAKGLYIAFLDSDDIWMPQKLARQIDALENHAEFGWSYGKAVRFGNKTQEGTPEIGWWQVHSGSVFKSMLLGNFVPSCTVVVRAGALKEVGPFDMSPDLRSTEDYELWLRLAERFPVYAVNETIAKYRVTADSVSENLASRFDPERKALESAQRKLHVPEPLMRKAFAALHMRHFRYTIKTDPAKAMAHLESSWTLNPYAWRTALYKSAATLGGAAAAQQLIGMEKWLKRSLG